VPDVNIREIATQYLSRFPMERNLGARLVFEPDVVQEEFPNRLLPNGATPYFHSAGDRTIRRLAGRS
jgi:hypothetical protein